MPPPIWIQNNMPTLLRPSLLLLTSIFRKWSEHSIVLRINLMCI